VQSLDLTVLAFWENLSPPSHFPSNPPSIQMGTAECAERSAAHRRWTGRAGFTNSMNPIFVAYLCYIQPSSNISYILSLLEPLSFLSPDSRTFRRADPKMCPPPPFLLHFFRCVFVDVFLWLFGDMPRYTLQ